MKENIKRLDEIMEMTTVRVLQVIGAADRAKRLADMGVTPGTVVHLVRRTLRHGPIEISLRGSNLVLGAEVAANILVEEVNN